MPSGRPLDPKVAELDAKILLLREKGLKHREIASKLGILECRSKRAVCREKNRKTMRIYIKKWYAKHPKFYRKHIEKMSAYHKELRQDKSFREKCDQYNRDYRATLFNARTGVKCSGKKMGNLTNKMVEIFGQDEVLSTSEMNSRLGLKLWKFYQTLKDCLKQGKLSRVKCGKYRLTVL